MILPGCCLATLLVDFAENYDHIARCTWWWVRSLPHFVLPPKLFITASSLQVMTQYGFFNATGTVILVVVLHTWNHATNKREGVSHFMITDDLKRTNMQVCKFLEDLFFEEDAQLFAPTQQHLKRLILFSDNCGYQFKSGWAQQFALFISSS